MNYIDFLNDDKVVGSYNKIDLINPHAFNHGLKHVKNVCEIMNDLCDKLGIDNEEKEALLIACVLHDVGQTDGRENHGEKSKLFIIKYFDDELKNNYYYFEILNSVYKHSSPFDANDSMFTALVKFCDKVDFTQNRLENDYRRKFPYFCWEDVNRVEFIYDDEFFGINIISNEVSNFKELFLSNSHTKKVIDTLCGLASKLNRKPIVLNNNNRIM